MFKVNIKFMQHNNTKHLYLAE